MVSVAYKDSHSLEERSLTAPESVALSSGGVSSKGQVGHLLNEVLGCHVLRSRLFYTGVTSDPGLMYTRLSRATCCMSEIPAGTANDLLLYFQRSESVLGLIPT